jgi:hypothetical protein
MARYRWATPYKWLDEKSNDWDICDLRNALMNLALVSDSDTLQDVFEDEMDGDGYFDDLDAPHCAERGCIIEEYDVRWGSPHIEVSDGGVLCDDCYRDMT